ncbi:hypothetical protein T492DRAFT_59926 [Pavlovales sp. CCMP2436]|nr:hypothetical protein T492DRAFT_59926 [Pavlovales sp. CCMP2436]
MEEARPEQPRRGLLPTRRSPRRPVRLADGVDIRARVLVNERGLDANPPFGRLHRRLETKARGDERWSASRPRSFTSTRARISTLSANHMGLRGDLLVGSSPLRGCSGRASSIVLSFHFV